MPPSVLREAGVAYGSLVEIEAKDGKIILEPKHLKEDDFVGEDWEAMDKLVAKQVDAGELTQYSDPKAALKHFKRPRK